MRLRWPAVLLAVGFALPAGLAAPIAAALQPAESPTSEPPSPPPLGRRGPRVPKGRRPPGVGPTSRPMAPPAEPAEDLDRTVVRWYARGGEGVAAPKFITARELAFEARLESLTTQSSQTAPYTAKDIRAAIQRHISETMLASLPVSDKPTPYQVASYAEGARELIAQRIAADLPDTSVEVRRAFGLAKLDAARRAEGISREELDTLLRRRARASWYLDKMVAPMLKPSELDLREAHRRGETPFTNQAFDDVRDAIERWYISSNLATALDRYFRNVRSRVRVYLIGQPPRADPPRAAPPQAAAPTEATAPPRAARTPAKSTKRRSPSRRRRARARRKLIATTAVPGSGR